MSSLQSQITDGIKDAMRSKDKIRLATLRDVKSKFMLELSKPGASEEVRDEEAIVIISKLHRQRVDTSDVYKEQNREDLASDELAQAEILAEFLPKALSESEIESKVAEIIEQTGASGMGDMGRVMGMASAAMAGRADGKVISGFVKSQLLK